MALIHSKQLNPRFTGSFTISGSNALNTIGGITSDTLTLTHITASGNISNVSTTNVTASGNVEVGEDLFVTQYIKHKGDENTFINFTDNRIQFKAGDIGFFDMEKDADAPYPATINPGGNRVNFRVMDRNTELLLKTDSEAFNVGLYHAGNKKLETTVGGVDITGHITASGNISASGTVFASRFEAAGQSNEIISFNDNLNITGNITASGDISGSSTSTGSFAKIEMTNGTSLNTGNFAISGSTLSTASFGLIKIHEIQGNSTIAFGDNILMKRDLEFLGNITGSGNIRTSGNVIASRFEASGSNSMQFGVTSADKHEFTGSVAVTGSFNVEKGRIFEQGTSVIDHATAMAIVFGG